MAIFALAWAWLVPVLAKVCGFLARCKPCLIVLAFVIVAVVSNWAGHHKAVLQCQEAQLYARIAKQRADLENARISAADATARANAIEENASEQRQKDAEYIAGLSVRPACDLTDDDIGGLPNHRHRNGARPAAARK